MTIISTQPTQARRRNANPAHPERHMRFAAARGQARFDRRSSSAEIRSQNCIGKDRDRRVRYIDLGVDVRWCVPRQDGCHEGREQSKKLRDHAAYGEESARTCSRERPSNDRTANTLREWV